MNSIDNCNCETYKDQYLNLSNKYDNLSSYDKNIFDNALTSDNETTYLERLQYIINLCKSMEEQINNNKSNGDNKENEQINDNNLIFVIIIASSITILYLIFIVLFKKKILN